MECQKGFVENYELLVALVNVRSLRPCTCRSSGSMIFFWGGSFTLHIGKWLGRWVPWNFPVESAAEIRKLVGRIFGSVDPRGHEATTARDYSEWLETHDFKGCE